MLLLSSMRREDAVDYKSLLTRWFRAHGIEPRFSKFFCVDGNVAVAVDGIDERIMILKARVVSYDASDDEVELEPAKIEIVLVVSWQKPKFLSLLRRLIARMRFRFKLKKLDRDFNDAGEVTNEDCKHLLRSLKNDVDNGILAASAVHPRIPFNKNVTFGKCNIDDLHVIHPSYMRFNGVEDLEMKLAIAGV